MGWELILHFPRETNECKEHALIVPASQESMQVFGSYVLQGVNQGKIDTRSGNSNVGPENTFKNPHAVALIIISHFVSQINSSTARTMKPKENVFYV